MKKLSTEVLVIGGGAAGLSAAAEAASAGAKVLVVESDLRPGGQLIKQTHKFFGSKDEYAGTRGFKIADILLDEINSFKDSVSILQNTTVSGYYKEDDEFTAMRGEEEYFHIKAKKTIVATGAQERLIPFPNNDIPGVYGAGAVQTLMNVYGVLPGRRVLMVGAGNIGLIVTTSDAAGGPGRRSGRGGAQGGRVLGPRGQDPPDGSADTAAPLDKKGSR